MTDDLKSPPEDEAASFIGEEESDERSTPGMNLGAAIVIGLLSILAMALSLRMPNPSTIYTAPGLLPFLTGLSLLIMAFALAKGTSAGRAATLTMRPSRPSIAFTAALHERKHVVAFIRIKLSQASRLVETIGPIAKPPAT